MYSEIEKIIESNIEEILYEDTNVNKQAMIQEFLELLQRVEKEAYEDGHRHEYASYEEYKENKMFQ